jgi:hypothetical protein
MANDFREQKLSEKQAGEVAVVCFAFVAMMLRCTCLFRFQLSRCQKFQIPSYLVRSACYSGLDAREWSSASNVCLSHGNAPKIDEKAKAKQETNHFASSKRLVLHLLQCIELLYFCLFISTEVVKRQNELWYVGVIFLFSWRSQYKFYVIFT